ncbi:MAG TPA: hypothetical protein VKS79_24595 [Gemmataceae bacterium]|nr:hypothetical protein [Gemmataceae bacterium]
MKSITTVLVIVGFLPFLMGASISLTDTPNPGGNPQQIQGSGTWSVAQGETATSIQYQVTLKGSNPPQTTQSTFKPTGNTWSSTLSVAAATYNPCQVTLYYTANGMANTFTTKDMNDQVVR